MRSSVAHLQDIASEESFHLRSLLQKKGNFEGALRFLSGPKLCWPQPYCQVEKGSCKRLCSSSAGAPVLPWMHELHDLRAIGRKNTMRILLIYSILFVPFFAQRSRDSSDSAVWDACNPEITTLVRHACVGFPSTWEKRKWSSAFTVAAAAVQAETASIYSVMPVFTSCTAWTSNLRVPTQRTARAELQCWAH